MSIGLSTRSIHYPSIHSYLYYAPLAPLCSWQTRLSGVQVKSRGQCRVRPSVSLTYDLAGVSWASTGHVLTRDTTAGDRRFTIVCVRINDVTTNAFHLYDLCPIAARTPLLPDYRCALRQRSHPYRWVDEPARESKLWSTSNPDDTGGSMSFYVFPLSLCHSNRDHSGLFLVWLRYENLKAEIIFCFY